MAQQINLSKYTAEVKKNFSLSVSDEIIQKDLLLTLVLAELEKRRLGKELIFKGGTLLSRNYLKYHRFSEDLDFVHKDSNKLRELSRNAREKRIKLFIDAFAPELSGAAVSLGLKFSTNRSDTKFCSILHGRAVYTFRLYYSETGYMKIEINFVEKTIHEPKEVSVRAITDFFDSKELMFVLGLKIANFRVLSYTLEEIILEKYRAILTRHEMKERDLFDLFLIHGSLKPSISSVVEKISCSSLIKRDLHALVSAKLDLLKKGEFFSSNENIGDLAIVKYDIAAFWKFKEKIKPILIKICEEFLKK